MIAPSEFTTLDERLADELREAFDRVLRSGWYVLGPEVEAFEREFAAWVGAPHAIGVASGTDALQLSLAALGIGAGDEVILPSNALPTAYGVAATGAALRFCDARPDDLNLDPDGVLALVGPRTRAVVAVHLYGHPVDVPALRRALAGTGVAVVEDCAQAHGAKLDGQGVGTMGDVAAFSFYPTKNLGAMGDGGAVTTSDPELALRVARLRVYGEDRRYHSVALGTNSRLDELQAALLRVKLRHLDGWLERRRELAASYDELLADMPVELPPCRPGVTHARHLYPLRVDERDAVLASLREQGVPVAVHYPLGAHDQPCFAGTRERDLPVTEALGRRLLSLPMHAGLTPADAAQVAAALERALARSAAAAV